MTLLIKHDCFVRTGGRFFSNFMAFSGQFCLLLTNPVRPYVLWIHTLCILMWVLDIRLDKKHLRLCTVDNGKNPFLQFLPSLLGYLLVDPESKEKKKWSTEWWNICRWLKNFFWMMTYRVEQFRLKLVRSLYEINWKMSRVLSDFWNLLSHGPQKPVSIVDHSYSIS